MLFNRFERLTFSLSYFIFYSLSLFLRSVRVQIALKWDKVLRYAERIIKKKKR